jgi:hypothetical protein
LANRKSQIWQCGFNNLAKVEFAKVEKWPWWNTQAFGILEGDTQHPYSWAFLLQKTDGKAAAPNTVTWKSLTMSHNLWKSNIPPQIQGLWQGIKDFFSLHSHVAYTIVYFFH